MLTNVRIDVLFQSLLQRHTNVIDEIKGFADDVNRLREQSKLMESSEKAAQVNVVTVIYFFVHSSLPPLTL